MTHTPHGVDTPPATAADPAKAALQAEYDDLCTRMRMFSLTPGEHYRAAELVLGTAGDPDSFTSDMQQATVHALLADHDGSGAARLKRELTEARQLADDLRRQVELLSIGSKVARDELTTTRSALHDACQQATEAAALHAQLDQARRAQAADVPPCPADLAGMRRDATTAREHGDREWHTLLASHIDRLVTEVARLRAESNPASQDRQAAPSTPLGWYAVDHDAATWIDGKGKIWDLRRKYIDCGGKSWHWAGGSEAIGDLGEEPIMSRDDYTIQDAPITLPLAQFGPFKPGPLDRNAFTDLIDRQVTVHTNDGKTETGVLSDVRSHGLALKTDSLYGGLLGALIRDFRAEDVHYVEQATEPTQAGTPQTAPEATR